MNWYYAAGQQQQGPVDDAQLDALVAAGTVTPESLVWREGMANWQPLRVARPAASIAPPGAVPPVAIPPGSGPVPGAAPAPHGQVQCAECRAFFPKEETIQYGNLNVCAACKPVFVQRLREGGATAAVPGAMPNDPEELVRLIQERGYSIDLGSCFSRSWELVKANFWLCVGACFVAWIVQQSAGLLGLIPVVGFLFVLCLQGPFQAGLYNFFLKLMRGQEASVGDVFSGFGPRFLQLMLTILIPGLIAFAALIIVGVVIGVSGGFGGPGSGRSSGPPVVLLLFIPVLGIPFLYFVVSWAFAIPLVMDKRMPFWPALETSRKVVRGHWWSVFMLVFFEAVLMFVGVLACVVGVFVAIPVATGMHTQAYEDIFGTGRALGT